MTGRDPKTIGAIMIAPDICGGAPCFAGTRIPVTAISAFRRDGYSDEDIFAEYPDLTIADIEAAIAFDVEQRPWRQPLRNMDLRTALRVMVTNWAVDQLDSADPRRKEVCQLVTNRADSIAEAMIEAWRARWQDFSLSGDPTWEEQLTIAFHIRELIGTDFNSEDPLVQAALAAALCLERINGSSM